MKNNSNKRRWIAPLSAAAALAIVAGSIFGISRFQQASAADSVVTLDINPSIALSVNNKETVTTATPLNDDAKDIMGGMELEGTNLETAVNAIIGACLQKGYLDELENAILVSVENADADTATQLQNELTTTISGAFQSGAILTQTVTVDDDLAQLAQQLLHLALGLGGELLPGMAGRAGLGDVLRRPQGAHLGGVEGAAPRPGDAKGPGGLPGHVQAGQGALPVGVHRQAAVVVLGAQGDLQGLLPQVDAVGGVQLDGIGIHVGQPLDGRGLAGP